MPNDDIIDVEDYEVLDKKEVLDDSTDSNRFEDYGSSNDNYSQNGTYYSQTTLGTGGVIGIVVSIIILVFLIIFLMIFM